MSRTYNPAGSAASPMVVRLSGAEGAAAEAQDLEELAAQRPDDREELLVEAIWAWWEAEDHERSLTLCDQLLADEGSCDAVDEIHALRVCALWCAGHVDQARAAADAFRARHPRDGSAWSLVADQFESVGELDAAAEWFTVGLTHVLGASTPVTTDTVLGASNHVQTLVIGRHRVRRALRLPHDAIDEVAHDVHGATGDPFAGDGMTLDELHDPDLSPDMQAERLRAVNARLKQEVKERQEHLHAPETVTVVHWAGGEFDALVQRWPQLAEFYGGDAATHTRRVESLLVAKSDEGEPRLGVAAGTVAGLVDFATSAGADPADTRCHAEYAADLADRGRFVSWPPSRNGPCWCGSERKYKKCCGNPAAR